VVVLLRVDFNAGSLTVAPGSCDERVLALPKQLIPASRIRSIDVHPDSLVVGLPDGRDAVVEMGDSGAGEKLRAGRPIVYLDQNHWSLMAVALSGERPVPQAVSKAARWLAARVDAEEILLPLSAGRLVETGALYGGRRETVASALLRFSRGWQMRNPSLVRREELASALATGVRPNPVFVPGMADTFASATDGPQRRVSWAIALYEAMLETDAVEDPDAVGAKAKAAWAAKWTPIAVALRRDRASATVVARAARANLLLDAADDVAAVARALGRQPDEVIEALRQPGVVDAQPMLGLMLQVLTARLHNADQRPLPGDLFDFVYLPCAAAYADVLVGERRMIGYLRGARRPAPRAALAANLPEAVPRIKALLSVGAKR